jgi:hypothetical protein
MHRKIPQIFPRPVIRNPGLPLSPESLVMALAKSLPDQSMLIESNRIQRKKMVQKTSRKLFNLCLHINDLQHSPVFQAHLQNHIKYPIAGRLITC